MENQLSPFVLPFVELTKRVSYDLSKPIPCTYTRKISLLKNSHLNDAKRGTTEILSVLTLGTELLNTCINWSFQ